MWNIIFPWDRPLFAMQQMTPRSLGTAVPEVRLLSGGHFEVHRQASGGDQG